MTIPRSDHRTARIVDTGSILADQFGALTGARYMRRAGVPLMVTLRVVLFPSLRRSA